MCVIIVKPAGAEMPSRDILNAAFHANPNGCGFVSTRHAYKSLDYRKFIKALSQVRRDEDCIIHFRLATHGSIKRANCHPFRCGDVWLAHNGILDIAPVGDMTDSETALRTVIAPAIDRYGLVSPLCDKAINAIRGFSKFAIMQGETVRLYGAWVERHGLYFSNLRFLTYCGWQLAYRRVPRCG